MPSIYRRHGKRMLDLMLAVPLLLVMAPAMFLMGILIRIKLGSAVLFTQVRLGRGARPFRLIKFRTMTDQRDASGQLLPDEQRLTPFGRFLRSTSVDEIPELWNVVLGDMSLVGPRPLLTDYCSHYSSRQARRHEVQPGLTGLAQVNGRNALSWKERFEYDLEYVEKVSFQLDLMILAKTILSVVRRDGITAQSHATMPRFDEEAVRSERERHRGAA